MLYGVIIHATNFTFWRKPRDMGTDNQDKEKTKEHHISIYKSVMKFLEHPFYATVAGTITATGIVSVCGYLFAIKPLSDRMDSIETNIGQIVETNLKDVKLELSEDVEQQLSEFKTEIENEIESKINSTTSNNINITVGAASPLAKVISSTYYSDETVYLNSGSQALENMDSAVIEDIITGEKYPVEVFENEIINLSYEDEEGKETLFRGQYDENGYWNGNCIINKYSEGKLVLIMDATYESGELKEYIQVFPYKTTSGNDVWAVSERQIDENGHNGKTTTYFKTEEIAKENKIFTARDFMNGGAFRMEGYYNGYTSDGYFNDNSENAYLVKYNEDGSVRFLYRGRIKGGLPDDNTGNAWSISWGYADDGYYYYEGVFQRGKHEEMPLNWTSMTQEEINEKVRPEDFECPLTGLITNGVL